MDAPGACGGASLSPRTVVKDAPRQCLGQGRRSALMVGHELSELVVEIVFANLEPMHGYL